MFTMWKALEDVLCNVKALQSTDNSYTAFSAIKQKGNGTDSCCFLVYKKSCNAPLADT